MYVFWESIFGGNEMAILSMFVIMLFLLICFAAIIALLCAVLGIGSVGITTLISGIVLTLTGKNSRHSTMLNTIGIILLIFGIITLLVFSSLIYYFIV